MIKIPLIPPQEQNLRIMKYEISMHCIFINTIGRLQKYH